MRFLLRFLTGLWLATTVQAADWPGIQGPSWNGHTPEVLQANWPEDGPALLWFRELGQGYSSVAVAGDRCITQTQTVLGQVVICLRVTDGTTLWEHACGPPYEAFSVYPGPRATPTIEGNAVYYATPEGEIGSLDLVTGKKRWTKSIVTDFEGQGVGFGYSASPLVRQGLVLLPCGGPGGSVIALDATSGERVWSAGDQPASYCPLVPIELAGESLVVAYLQNTRMILDLKGTILWREQTSHGYDEHSTLPVYSEPLLIFSAPFKAGATAFRLSWNDAAGGERTLKVESAWSQPRFSNDVNTCVEYAGLLLGFDLRDPQSKAHRPSRGEFRCLDIETGEILWSRNDIGQSGIVVADDQLLLFNDAGEILLATVSREDCTIRARASVFPNAVCWTRPALSAGRLFLRGGTQLVALQVGLTGERAHPDLPEQRIADLSHGPSFSWNVLLGGEREHPFMLPEAHELWAWYLAGLSCVFIPLLGVACWPFGRDRPATELQLNRACAATILMAMLLTPALNAMPAGVLVEESLFHFAWPAALFAALQGTVLASYRVRHEPQCRSMYWQARAWGSGWLLLSLGYFVALRSSSLPLQWVFLMGYVPALPCTMWTAHCATTGSRLRAVIATLFLGYSLFFWMPVGFDQWRLLR